MDRELKVPRISSQGSCNLNGSASLLSPFPVEVLKKVFSFINSHKDRNSVSLVCTSWYNAERWTRTDLFIGNCYSVSHEIVARWFPRINSIRLKGKPRFSDFNLLPRDWGADVHSWLVMFAKVYPFLEELRLKRMTVSDKSLLQLLVKSFPSFKAVFFSCDGFGHTLQIGKELGDIYDFVAPCFPPSFRSSATIFLDTIVEEGADSFVVV